MKATFSLIILLQENAMGYTPKVKDSVIAVFIYDNSVFLIQRQPYLSAFPGYHSFPGGKIDSDESSQPYATEYLKDHPPLFMRALCREILEELNFDLESAIFQGDILEISEFASAVTPKFNPHRFQTYFYRIVLNRLVEFEADKEEAEKGVWLTGTDFLRAYHQGKILVVPPTLWIMQALADNIHCVALGVLRTEHNDQEEVPCVEFINKVYQLPVLSHTLPPAHRTNAFVIGDSPDSFLIDPSPESSEELRKLMFTLKSFQLTGIFLTHHHVDHHERSNELARVLNLPIHLSTDTFQMIQNKWGPNYFEGISICCMKEGDTLTQWMGKDVVIYAIPGHDEGQLGLAPLSMEWFIVGDLLQNVGTVVIAAPEGDMKKYFASLERVIQLAPKIIFPSHGIPMRGTYWLEETLRHRQQRELQVLELYRQGKNKEAMLKEIYKEIDPRLFPYAMKNIESHLQKLGQENRLLESE